MKLIFSAAAFIFTLWIMIVLAGAIHPGLPVILMGGP